MTARRTAAGGFTLIETLIALTLIGLMMAGLFASLRFGARAWEAGDARMTATQAQAAHNGLLRQLISGTVPRLILPDGDWVAGLEGTADRLTVLGPWVNPHGPGGLHLFELKTAADGKGLLLDWWLARLPRPTAAAAPGRVLLPGVEGIGFRYFGAWGDSAQPVWRDDWPANRRLPLLVAIGGAADGGAGALVIAPAGAGE